MIGRQREEERVGGLRPQLLLEHQLDDVGERLQQPLPADADRAEPLLQRRRQPPLDPDHGGRREQQRVEDDRR